MNVRNCFVVGLSLLAIGLFAGIPSASAQANLTTDSYDQARTGANLNETQLNTSNVNVNQFGKLWSYTVSGSIFAQPLYVQGVSISGASHNVLYVVTMNDVVYAFDADSSSNIPLWSLNVTSQVAGSTPVPIADITADGNIVGNVGIESTPYIDLATNTMYFVARTKETISSCGSINGKYCQRLHAVDITSGAEKFGGPVVIQGSVPGTGPGSVGGTLTFDPLIQNQRPSLALANGLIFIAWGSHHDDHNFHGWVTAYRASTLQETGIWSPVPNGAEGGVWMSGRAPAVDSSGNVYYISGNGDWNGSTNFSETMVKLGSTSGIPLVDWFTPDFLTNSTGDTDFGASGPLLIPGTDLVVGGGKASTFFLMHVGNLGHEQTGNGQIVQSFPLAGGEIKRGPVYWNRDGGVGPWMYVWSDGGDVIKAFHFNGTTFDPNFVSEGTIASPSGHSGAVLTLSASGSTPGSGIVWASMPLADDGIVGVHQGVLRALNADDLTSELWNSNLNSARASPGNWAKFSPPTVVNGRVYVGSWPSDGVSSTTVNVYGLLRTSVPDFTIAVSPGNNAATPGGSAAYTVSTTSLFGFSDNVSLSISGLPSGATASWSSTSIPTPGSATLTVATSTSTPVGTYTLTITGTDGSLAHSATANFLVSTTTRGSGAISIDFVGSSTTAMAASEVAGVVPKSNWNDASGANGNGLALVDETGTATGATVTWTASSLHSVPITETAGNFRMMRGYLDTANQNAIVTVAGLPTNSAGYDIYVYADGSNGTATRTGTYRISGAGITTTSINLTDAANTNFSGTFVQANNSNGNYVKFTINATSFTLTAIPGTASDGVRRAPVNGIQIIPHSTTSDFSISASPSSQTVTAGNSTTYTVTIGALNGFTGTVTLGASGLPTGATASFSPATISGSGTSTLTVTTASTTPAGTSTVTITGTSGSLTHSTTTSLVVSAASDFSISVSPSSQTVTAGNSTTYTVTIGALNGFTGTVALGASGLPTGATASFSPATISNSGTSTLTVTTASTTPAGTSTLTITGTSGSLTHSTTTSLVVTTIGAISIDLVGVNTTLMGASEVAGVVPKSNWNDASGANGNGLALVDETGEATVATVTWTASC